MPPQPTPPAATTDYATAYGELGSTYDPEVAAVNTDIAALPAQQAAAQASLDQAKANAFKSNALTSNARGVLFSGYTPQANSDYTANTYNPAVTNLNTKTQNQQQTLQDKITDINNQRAQGAESLVEDTQEANAKVTAAALRAQQSTDSKTATAATAASNKASSANYVQGKTGNYMFVDNSGKAINLQQYVTNTGGDINTVLNLLQNGTTYDKNIYNKVLASKPANATAALNLIRQLDTKKAYGF